MNLAEYLWGINSWEELEHAVFEDQNGNRYRITIFNGDVINSAFTAALAKYENDKDKDVILDLSKHCKDLLIRNGKETLEYVI